MDAKKMPILFYLINSRVYAQTAMPSAPFMFNFVTKSRPEANMSYKKEK